MKPTQEQVIAWALEAGDAEELSEFFFHPVIERFAALAYEAGRKDENEAIEKILNKNKREKFDTFCSRCGSLNIGNSPTGWWCNSCGVQSPCKCCGDKNVYCTTCDKTHVHTFNEHGDCTGRKDGCAAKEQYQLDPNRKLTIPELMAVISARREQ